MSENNGFDNFINELKLRRPEWFNGESVARTVPLQRNASQAHFNPLGDQMLKERVEFDRKQATSDHDDGDRESRYVTEASGILGDWDGYEQEDTK